MIKYVGSDLLWEMLQEFQTKTCEIICPETKISRKKWSYMSLYMSSFHELTCLFFQETISYSDKVIIKVNESQYISLLLSADLLINLLMLFSTDCVDIFFNRLKSVGLPQIAYRGSLTLNIKIPKSERFKYWH